MDKTILTTNQPIINLGVKAVGDLKETKDNMAVENMKILSFDVPTKNSTIYKRDSFVNSISNSPITTIVTSPSDIEHAMSPEEFAERIN